MNLGEDRRESVNVLTSGLFPVLVLLKVWSEGSDPCGNIDLILLLLEAVCALEGVQEEVHCAGVAVPGICSWLCSHQLLRGLAFQPYDTILYTLSWSRQAACVSIL